MHLESTPTLIPLLKTDPPCTYFSAIALAILFVSAHPSFTACLSPSANNNNNSNTNNSVLLGMHGIPLKLSDCPPPLCPLMSEFSVIGLEAVHIKKEDTMVAIWPVQKGHEREVAVPQLEYVCCWSRGLGMMLIVGAMGIEEQRVMQLCSLKRAKDCHIAQRSTCSARSSAEAFAVAELSAAGAACYSLCY